ncbi:MAG TPA: TatD family hydrolase, partial [Balneolaceae bacterium]|nr:TatD family hydrolase [Balneolaceae bacterium]
MIDTHCHIYSEEFDEDFEAVLDRAAEAGVKHIFMPAINFDSLPKMDRIHHPKITFHKMAGIHPTEINEGVSTTEDELMELCTSEAIVGVGETGLDYYWSDDFKKEQQKSLRIHCKVAKAVKKPIILHNRESTDDLLSIIEDEQDGNLTGIWHCFNGSVDEGKRAIDMGLQLGIGGVLTFKNAGVDKTVAQLPLENMMLETDAPYLAPTPKRGKRNEPAFVKYTAKRLAEVKDIALAEGISQTSQNALRLFGQPWE